MQADLAVHPRRASRETVVPLTDTTSSASRSMNSLPPTSTFVADATTRTVARDVSAIAPRAWWTW
jgi:hypothetical protein